ILRDEYLYKKSEGGAEGTEIFVFTGNDVLAKGFLPRRTITKTAEGHTWRDRKGNKIQYDTDGKIQYLEDKVGVRVTFTRDEKGRIHQVKDHLDHLIYTISYNDSDQVTAVEDYSGRKVIYTWSGGDLKEVKDVRGNTWKYEYTTKSIHGNEYRLMKSKTDPLERTTAIKHEILSGTVCLDPPKKTENTNTFKVSNNNNNGGGSYYSVKSIGCQHSYTNSSLILKQIKWSETNYETYDYYYDGVEKTHSMSTTYPDGSTIEEVFNEDGQLLGKYHNKVLIKKTTRDGRKFIHEDERGLKTIREYDEWRNLKKVTYPDNTTESWTYNGTYSQVLTHTNQEGTVTKYDYNDNGTLQQRTEALGLEEERKTSYTYDNYGNIATIKRHGDAVTEEAIIKYSYDEYGNTKTFESAEGITTQYKEHDALGNAWLVVDPRGKEWRYEFDGDGNTLKKYSPLGYQAEEKYFTEYKYYADGKLWQIVNPEGETKSYFYDASGYSSRIVDALGNEKIIKRDFIGRVLEYTDAENITIKKAYDIFGRLISKTDEHGNKMTYEYQNEGNKPLLFPDCIKFPTFKREFIYDDNKRIKQVYDTPYFGNSRKLVTELEYNVLGKLAIVKGVKQNKKEYEYDKLGRPRKIVDASSASIEFTYDNRNNILSVTDAQQSVTTYDYDKDGRKVKEKRPMGEQYLSIYSDSGYLEYTKDPIGNISYYQYDADGRLKEKKVYSFDDLNEPEKNIFYTYYNDGLLESYNDQTTSTLYSYTPNNQLQSEIIDFGPFKKGYSYDYYKNGDLKTYTDPENQRILYTYDNNRQLKSITIPNVGNYSVVNYKLREPERVVYPGGTVKTISYDYLMRYKNIEVKDQAGNIQMSYSYTYDDAGNISNKITEYGDYSYEHDDLYRLIEVVNPNKEVEKFSYDSVGNRKTSSDTRGSEEWQYNANHELQSKSKTNYQYDANGSTILIDVNQQNTTLLYNAANRLKEIRNNENQIVAKYQYDPLGRRISKEVAGKKTYFFYTLHGLSGEYTENGELIRGYGYKPEGHWTTAPVYLKTGNARNEYFFYQNDSLGTPQKLMSVSGAVVWSARYKVFGKAVIGISLIENPLRFAGQYEDAETGWHYNFNRYYAPELGRYLSSDPIGLLGGVNTYSYVGGVLEGIDPLGLQDEWYKADYFLIGYFYSGIGGHTDISKIGCGDYLLDPVIKEKIRNIKGNIDMQVEVYDNMSFKKENDKINEQIHRPFSIGYPRGQNKTYYSVVTYECGLTEKVGLHPAEIIEVSQCVITFRLKDLFVDPLDIWEYGKAHPIYGKHPKGKKFDGDKGEFSSFANVGGEPFSFGMTCRETYYPDYKRTFIDYNKIRFKEEW
ncbi:MAG: RHS repeat protein, partial [Gammaproteobacteria bacterium]